MNISSSFLSRSGIFAGSLLGAFALTAFASTTWTPPSSVAPGNNVDTPLNVGTTAQTKQGGSIQINGSFGIAGGTFVYLPTGVTQTAGMVLASDPTTPGKVVWTSTSTLGIGGPGIGAASSTGNSIHGIYSKTVAGTYTWTVPAGVNYIKVKAWGGGGGASYAMSAHGLVGALGGGGGSYSESILSVTPGAMYSVVVGAAGVSGQSLFPAYSGTVTDGGNTYFGVYPSTPSHLVSATGGSAGIVSQTGGAGSAGAGGAAGIGQFTMPGGHSAPVVGSSENVLLPNGANLFPIGGSSFGSASLGSGGPGNGASAVDQTYFPLQGAASASSPLAHPGALVIEY